jgi:hypothetical protein
VAGRTGTSKGIGNGIHKENNDGEYNGAEKGNRKVRNSGYREWRIW